MGVVLLILEKTAVLGPLTCDQAPVPEVGLVADRVVEELHTPFAQGLRWQ